MALMMPNLLSAAGIFPDKSFNFKTLSQKPYIHHLPVAYENLLILSKLLWI
jgi:hypothetical protein